jgi:hypothetical protein
MNSALKKGSSNAPSYGFCACGKPIAIPGLDFSLCSSGCGWIVTRRSVEPASEIPQPAAFVKSGAAKPAKKKAQSERAIASSLPLLSPQGGEA